jgi:hypothetical protein
VAPPRRCQEGGRGRAPAHDDRDRRRTGALIAVVRGADPIAEVGDER